MKQPINMHKELAMTGKISGMAKGGVAGPMAGTAIKVKGPKGMPLSPLSLAKRNNGVPGMKKGGKP